MFLFITILSILLIVLSVLPFIQNQHWVFRVPEFMKLQLLVLQIIVCPFLFLYIHAHTWIWIVILLLIAFIIYHIYLFLHFTRFWKKTIKDSTGEKSQPIKILSVNVLQFNTAYQKLINLVRAQKPDIILTMESNKDWEVAMRAFEDEYPFQHKVTLENTYGMHFYTHLKVLNAKTHYFVADDLPSMEIELETEDGDKFVFFGVHPPPPSPTEETTSKERDGDLMCVAKRVKEISAPVVVVGDFNNVAWAKSSLLFRRASRLIDARVGRGLIVTFHAKYWFFRIPLDLLFHSPSIFIEKLKTYPSIESDHYPLECIFHINKEDKAQKELIQTLSKDEKIEVEALIDKGKEEQSDNRTKVN